MEMLYAMIGRKPRARELPSAIPSRPFGLRSLVLLKVAAQSPWFCRGCRLKYDTSKELGCYNLFTNFTSEDQKDKIKDTAEGSPRSWGDAGVRSKDFRCGRLTWPFYLRVPAPVRATGTDSA